MLFWLCRGRAYLKAQMAMRVQPDPKLLPYHQGLLERLRQEKASGRRLILASASNQFWVQAVADHLGIFDDVLASDGKINLRARQKRFAIEAHNCGKPYAYAGNSDDDRAVWHGAAEVWVINARAALQRDVLLAEPRAVVFPRLRLSMMDLIRALRLYQWAKNILLFLPLLAAHCWDVTAWWNAFLGFLIFGCCASATYIVNDLWDLGADRMHPRKRFRPFASGRLSIVSGLFLLIFLLPISLWAAAGLSWVFFGLLLLYVVITIAYSLYLKKIPLVDVLVLAFLYIHRIFSGGVLVGLTLTHWLIMVALFMFVSLALVKRCTELQWMRRAGKTNAAGRGYRVSDLPYLSGVGVTSGLVAIMVLALYIQTQSHSLLYSAAYYLWFILPVLLYWVMRLWIKTTRMQVHDDPLLFAIQDKPSWVVAILVAFFVCMASFA